MHNVTRLTSTNLCFSKRTDTNVSTEPCHLTHKIIPNIIRLTIYIKQ